MKPWLFATLVAATSLTCLPGAAAIQDLNLEFASPAQVNGQNTVNRGQWVLLVLNHESAAAFELRVQGTATATNYTVAYSHLVTVLNKADIPVQIPPDEVDVPRDFHAKPSKARPDSHRPT